MRPATPTETPTNFGFLTDPNDPSSAPLPAGYIPSYATFLGLGVTPGSGGFTTPNGTLIPTASFSANYLTNNDYGIHDPNSPLITNSRAIQPGDVVDADPRIISNLIADQSLNNPAAIAAAIEYVGLVGAEADAARIEIQNAFALANDPAAALAAAEALATQALAAFELAQSQQVLAEVVDQAWDRTVLAYQNSVNEAGEADAAAEAAKSAITGMGGLATVVVEGAHVLDVIDDVTAALALANVARTQAQQVVAALTPPDADFVATGAVAQAQAVLLAAGNLVGALNTLVSLGLNVPADDPAGTTVVEASDVTLLNNAVTALNSLVSLADALPGQLNARVVPAQNSAALAQANLDEANAALSEAETANDAAQASAASGATATAWAKGLLAAELEERGIELTSDGSLSIPNVAPDVGLSAPFNGWMTSVGQFFDHGLDLVGKGGFGTVYIPLQPDDPLYVPGSSTNFMAVTRATLDQNGNAVNKVTPFVDQNQTYTSNASAQVFHREYEMREVAPGVIQPFATGRLLNGVDGGLATWADIKMQARQKLGIELDDFDIHNIPQLLVDDYGNFIPHPVTGFAQLVISNGPPVSTASGTPGSPVDATLALKTGHAFLDDIAHNANPDAGEVADLDSATSTVPGAQPAGTYDNELLDRHFITGDGRGNENIGLTAVHHVFHSEHNRQIDLIKATLIDDAQALLAGGASQADAVAFLNEWLDVAVAAVPMDGAALVWDGERLFQAAKFPTEMQYQHLVFEEFARTVQPLVNVFNDYDATLDAAIVGEFAHTVYRFGHSMLTEGVDRYTPGFETIGPNGVEGAEQIGLIEAFLNPVEFNAGGMSADEAAGAIVRGMTRQVGNEIDEFVTDALRNNLVGLPLDLAAINIARGRELQVPTLQEARTEFFRGSGDAQVRPYTSWYDFMLNLKNPMSVVNFIAAYGTHDSVLDADTTVEKRDAAMKLVFGDFIFDWHRCCSLQCRSHRLPQCNWGTCRWITWRPQQCRLLDWRSC